MTDDIKTKKMQCYVVTMQSDNEDLYAETVDAIDLHTAGNLAMAAIREKFPDDNFVIIDYEIVAACVEDL